MLPTPGGERDEAQNFLGDTAKEFHKHFPDKISAAFCIVYHFLNFRTANV